MESQINVAGGNPVIVVVRRESDAIQESNNLQLESRMKRITIACLLAAIFVAPVSGAETTPRTSGRLTLAKQKLIELRKQYTDRHPRVQAQLVMIRELERQVTKQQEETVELRAARVKLADLRTRYTDKHPTVRTQLGVIEELERQVTKQHEDEDTVELRAARVKLASLRTRYTDQHPIVRAQLTMIEELEDPPSAE